MRGHRAGWREVSAEIKDWKGNGRVQEEIEKDMQKNQREKNVGKHVKREDGESKENRLDRRKEQWLQWLGTEVAVEYKACIYFFIFLFYYAVYRVLQGIYTASLLHMAEMILATYGMGYLQVLVLDNFDEAEHLRGKELGLSALCAALYTIISYLFGWFDREIIATGIFVFFCVAAYACAFLANKAKRYVDTKQLNAMLQAYQKGACGEEAGSRGACGKANKRR